MRINHLIQADVPRKLVRSDAAARFWLDSCGGRDQVAQQMQRDGWQAYEMPLPDLVARWCSALRPLMMDVGANTGFYSLLAAACGARHVHAFEPVTEIVEVLKANVSTSELSDRITLHQVALGAQAGEGLLFMPTNEHGLVETSASLNPKFHRQHSGNRPVPVRRVDDLMPSMTKGMSPGLSQGGGVPVLMKIDVKTAESEVLTGAIQVLRHWRPALVCEVLLGTDARFWHGLAESFNYVHFALHQQEPWLKAEQQVVPHDRARNHVFLPKENLALWMACL
jgi:FkbM family methyltransferase